MHSIPKRTFHLLIPAAFLASVIAVSGDPPAWWSAGVSPVIDPAAAENNRGPANIGQAKHMVKSALDALRPILPGATTRIEADLAPIVDLTVPDPKTPEWIEKQKAPLLLGQLKALARPFYNHLNTASPSWVLDQIQQNHNGAAVPGTHYWQVTGNPNHTEGGYYLWNHATSPDQNKTIATIGQLKAVFSLRFETLEEDPDFDDDGMPNAWELANGLNPNDSADAALDSDNDGLTNLGEFTNNTNPNTPHSDDDTLTDYEDAVPLDAEINWKKTPENHYVWIEQVTDSSDHGPPIAVNKHGQILFLALENSQTDHFEHVLWDSATRDWINIAIQSSQQVVVHPPSGNTTNETVNSAALGVVDINDSGTVVGYGLQPHFYGGICCSYPGMMWRKTDDPTDGDDAYDAPRYFFTEHPINGFQQLWLDPGSSQLAEDGTVVAWATPGTDASPQVWKSYDAVAGGLGMDFMDGFSDETMVSGRCSVLDKDKVLVEEQGNGGNNPNRVFLLESAARSEIPAGRGSSLAINTAPTLKDGGGERLWMGAKGIVHLEKRAGGSGTDRWHTPTSMGEGADFLHPDGVGITAGSATVTPPLLPVEPKLWRNGKYTDLNDEKLTSKPSSITITKAIDLASNGVILVQATENGVGKTGLCAPFGIDGHKRGTINAPGVKVAKGSGEYGQETVMMENADSEDNTTEPDYETEAVDAAKDNDLVKVVLHWPKDLKINGVKLELKHSGMEVDPTKTSDADKYKETGPSRLNFYKPDGTKLTDAELKIDDLGNPGTGYLAEILTTGNLTLFVEGAEKFGLVGNDPKSATASEKLGGAMLNFEVTQNETTTRSRLLVYRGGFLVYRMPKVSPPLPSKGVLGTLEFWDGKGRVKHVFGGKGKEFKEDETHWGTQLKSWPARSGRVNGKDYDIENGGGHVPPGWWIVYPVDLTKKPFVYPQPNRWEKDSNGVSYLRQGAYNRWSADDETDPSKRYTYDYKFYPILVKDTALGNPSQTSIMFKFDLDPIRQTKAQNRKGIQIHPDGECSDSVMGGTAGCIGLQTYSSCKEVYNWLSAYKGIKIKVLRE